MSYPVVSIHVLCTLPLQFLDSGLQSAPCRIQIKISLTRPNTYLHCRLNRAYLKVCNLTLIYRVIRLWGCSSLTTSTPARPACPTSTATLHFNTEQHSCCSHIEAGESARCQTLGRIQELTL